MAIYINYEGIKGNVTAEGFVGHLEADAVNFGVNRPISMTAGKMANREVGKPNITEVHISRVADNSLANLFKASVSGSSGAKVTLKFVRTATDKVEEFMTYTLSDCLISGYNISCHGDEEPHEEITLSFSECEVMYTDTDKTNKSGSPMRSGYNLTTAQAK